MSKDQAWKIFFVLTDQKTFFAHISRLENDKIFLHNSPYFKTA